MILIAIDPSISCTGVAAFKDGKLLSCNKIKPKSEFQQQGVRHKIPTWKQIEQIIDELNDWSHALTREANDFDVYFAIEITSGKVNRNHNSSGAGLGTYGMVVGQVARWCIETMDGHDERVMQIYENDWTRGTTKPQRQEHCRYAFPLYESHWYGKDKIRFRKNSRSVTSGGDVSDAIMLGDYAMQKLTIEGAIQ